MIRGGRRLSPFFAKNGDCPHFRAALILGLVTLLMGWIRCGPIPDGLMDDVAAPSTTIVDRAGRPLYEALSSGGARLQRLEPSALPPTLVAATVAAEDRRFWSHPGVDPLGWTRAAWHDLEEWRIVEGGSTITQQVAKLLLQRRAATPRHHVGSKLREIVLALRLEHRYSKREILAMYLNLASYGNQVSGAARASTLYFGVQPSMLTPAQAAFLAGLPQRPSAFNPWRSTAAAISRQRDVLRRMEQAGVLSPEQLQAALGERLSLESRHPAFLAPHFSEMVLADAPQPRPARIETTLDLDLQRDVEGIIDAQRESLAAHGAHNVAVVVLDNRTSEWLAWEGSGDYFDAAHGGTINGPRAARQPGSALKPFTYALAFEQGRGPATVLPDIPASFPTAEPGILYTPRNYDGRYRGPLLARRALAGSENVPAVALASDVGVGSLLRFLSRAGLSTFDRNAAYYGLGLTLGNAEVRLDELVAAYASFARGGQYVAPAAVRSAPHATRALVSPVTAFLVTDILSDADARAFIFGRGGNLEFAFPVAVKTGTSQAYHDNWTIGYTRTVTVGVWVGNFDRAPLRDSSGVTGAGPLFHAVMLAAVQRAGGPAADGDPIVPVPAGLERTMTCALSGMRATSACPNQRDEWVRTGEPALPCSWHHESDEGPLTIYPPEFRAWASQAHAVSASVESRVRTTSRPATPRAAPRARLEVLSPSAGATYSIDPTLRREFQALPLRAITAQPTTLTWYVDGQAVGTTSSERAVSWPLVVGRHDVEVRDAAGRAARAAVFVK
ncbi:MAG TPA: penicillin-binding protein 1C [Vicinamibacterales bacterium]|nr:penicillin-binding protein 1C [Vicinamibacterales bacterium]